MTDQNPQPIDLDDHSLYNNRELALLNFQFRVLEEAQDTRNPLLERLKFLAIVCSNLDEFFMVRVAGLKQQVDADIIERSPDGLTPPEQLAAVRKRALTLMQGTQDHLIHTLLPLLDESGIHLIDHDQLSKSQKKHMKRYFHDMVFPVLTPLAFDPGHPFPHISNLSLNLAVSIRDPDGQLHFARVKVPHSLPRLVPIRASSGGVRRDGTVPHHHAFVWLEQLITAHIDTLFPGMDVLAVHPFHVTRDADLVIQELEASDLLESIQQSLYQRRFGSVVRLTIGPNMPKHMLDLLTQNLEVDPNDIYTLPGPLSCDHLMALNSINRWDLKFDPYTPALPTRLDPNDGDIFEAIQQRDILVHRPYDSFLTTVELLEAAADDPNVLAIKQTLYRVGKNSPIVNALLKARHNGKQVAVLVELKARFDEESNIGWARRLESEGVHVVYGLLGLKTHSKLSLIIRKEHDKIRRYIHLSTGNYNAITAKLYTDLSLITCDPLIGADISDVFNYLTGYSAKTSYNKILIAPVTLRERFVALIEREIQHHNQGRPAHLIFKMNSLVDKPLIKTLYRASMQGVRIDLIVRGICCLKPGIEGVSDNIRVISIVGRYLEHSRIFYFHNGGQPEIYTGSADLMPRNINRRVEVLFPIEDPQWIQYIRTSLLESNLADNAKARQLQPDGTYSYVQPNDQHPPLNSQEHLMAIRRNRNTRIQPPTPIPPELSISED